MVTHEYRCTGRHRGILGARGLPIDAMIEGDQRVPMVARVVVVTRRAMHEAVPGNGKMVFRRLPPAAQLKFHATSASPPLSPAGLHRHQMIAWC